MTTRALASALFLSTLWAAGPARPAPAFTMLRLNQPSIRLSQYRGKVVALAFIATTCPHCQQFTVELNQIDRDYSHRGVQIVECAFNDEGPQAMREFLERFEPRFPVTYSTPAAVSAFLQRTMLDPRPLRVPVLVLIDRAGMIREEIGGEDNFFQNPRANLRAKLDKMLAR